MINNCRLSIAMLVLFLAGCAKPVPDSVKAVLDQPGSFELVSLHPHKPEAGTNEGDELLHGYRVLGRTQVTNAKDQQRLREAYYRAIRNADVVADCFRPRHAIRKADGEPRIDLLICFQCRHTEVYRDGKLIEKVQMTSTAQPVFDAILTAANVPLPQE